MSKKRYIKSSVGTSLSLSRTQQKLEHPEGKRLVLDIYREGAKHVTAAEVQWAKTILADELKNDIYKRVLEGVNDYRQKAFALMAEDSGNPDSDAWFENFSYELLERYKNHTNGITEVGITNIANEEHKPVIVDREESGWWKRLKG